MSISGGLPYLEFGGTGDGGFSGALRNMVLQRLIGERPNDGLVAESSSDITDVLGAAPGQNHSREYPAYDQINHTYLSRNQQIANILVRWLREVIQQPPTVEGQKDHRLLVPPAAASPLPALSAEASTLV
jgi:hypothetical protein